MKWVPHWITSYFINANWNALHLFRISWMRTMKKIERKKIEPIIAWWLVMTKCVLEIENPMRRIHWLCAVPAGVQDRLLPLSSQSKQQLLPVLHRTVPRHLAFTEIGSTFSGTTANHIKNASHMRLKRFHFRAELCRKRSLHCRYIYALLDNYASAWAHWPRKTIFGLWRARKWTKKKKAANSEWSETWLWHILYMSKPIIAWHF